jgi:pimeloyl-ACP methyl ester carboxylesterase
MIETQTVAVTGQLFTVDCAGERSGAPVLLLHGFPETRHMWRHQVAALAAAAIVRWRPTSAAIPAAPGPARKAPTRPRF